MSFGDRIETRSEFEAAELDRENRVSDGLAERRKDAVLVRIRMGEVAAEKLADACRRASYRAEDRMADAELSDEKRAQAEADYESLSWASRWLVAEEARCLEGVTDPEWEREHVEGWTGLLERAERCLSCDPDAGSSYVVAHAIRASIAAGTRKDDASRIRPTDGPPRLLVEIVTAGGVQVGDVLLLDGECCEVTDRGSRIGFTLWFGRTPEAFELDQPVVRVLDAAVMERGRPDDELEAALDADNPDPPLRS